MSGDNGPRSWGRWTLPTSWVPGPGRSSSSDAPAADTPAAVRPTPEPPTGPEERRKSGMLPGLGALGAASVGALRIGMPGWRSRDRWADDDLFELGVDRGGIVAALDGVPLAVREAGPLDAPITVVFVHGYCLTMDTWHFQRRALSRRFGDSIRMVFYDQRGHGKSSGTPRTNATIGQLAHDLHCVVESTVPSGPVVLVGHSMGGMTVMSYTSKYADNLRERVTGVGLVATAAGKLSDSGLGAVLESRALASFADLAGRVPTVFSGGRRAMAGVLRPFIAGGSFGDPSTVSPSVARLVDTLIAETDVETIAHFFDTLTRHDETASLPILADVRTSVVCGDRDLLTPLDRSQEIAAALPEAEFTVVPRAGHMVMLEQPEVVDDVLVRLVEDAARIAVVDLPAGPGA